MGPSLGQDNIDKGFASVKIGFVLVLIFMVLMYKAFGLAADVALALNLVLIVALLSMLQATLTLPGIAGIVLTVGMAVDANVLIFQRIREEIRNGNSPQASIHAGYEKAFTTIADANITTLFAAIVLFSFGTRADQGLRRDPVPGDCLLHVHRDHGDPEHRQPDLRRQEIAEVGDMRNRVESYYWVPVFTGTTT